MKGLNKVLLNNESTQPAVQPSVSRPPPPVSRPPAIDRLQLVVDPSRCFDCLLSTASNWPSNPLSLFCRMLAMERSKALISESLSLSLSLARSLPPLFITHARTHTVRPSLSMLSYPLFFGVYIL